MDVSPIYQTLSINDLSAPENVKVLQLYRTYFPDTQGGLEEAIRQICHATTRLGVEQRILTLAKVPKIEMIIRPEGRVIRAPLQMEPAACSMGKDLFKAYKEQAEWADIIHIHHPWPFADLVHLLSNCKKPVLLTYHSDIVRQKIVERFYAPLRMLFYRKVSRFVATSPNYASSSQVLQKYSERVNVIPLSLSPDYYPPATEAALKQVNRQFPRGFFLFIGVLRYYKGLHNLVKAATINGLPVVIAGDGPEGDKLKAMTEEAAAKNIYFTGFVSDEIKRALLQASKAIVFPSSERSEAFGVTLLEGQLYGKPLISCEIGTGTSFVNINGKTGIVIPPNDPVALAAAMEQIENQPDQAMMMGQAGRQRVQTTFSSQVVGQSYLKLYQELLLTH